MNHLIEQLVSKMAKSPISDRILLTDKRKGNRPNRKTLAIKEFQPHFGVGPTYYGIIDTGSQSWIEGHEYPTKAAADRALKKLRSGKSSLKFRGF